MLCYFILLSFALRRIALYISLRSVASLKLEGSTPLNGPREAIYTDRVCFFCIAALKRGYNLKRRPSETESEPVVNRYIYTVLDVSDKSMQCIFAFSGEDHIRYTRPCQDTCWLQEETWKSKSFVVSRFSSFCKKVHCFGTHKTSLTNYISFRFTGYSEGRRNSKACRQC